MACLDTTILIDAAGRGGRGLRARAREKLASLVDAGEVLTTTRFTVAELWVGVERPTAKERKRQERRFRILAISLRTITAVSAR